MKKLILLAGFYCLQVNLHAAPIMPAKEIHDVVEKNNHATTRANDRALAHFRENFADAKHPLWSTNADKSINCYFREGEKVYRIYYDRRGMWTYTLIGYQSSDLLHSIRYRVLENFDGYNIAYINEIRSENNEPIYIVHIENANSIKMIRISNNDDIVVLQEFQKN